MVTKILVCYLLSIRLVVHDDSPCAGVSSQRLMLIFPDQACELVEERRRKLPNRCSE